MPGRRLVAEVTPAGLSATDRPTDRPTRRAVHKVRSLIYITDIVTVSLVSTVWHCNTA